MPLDRAQRVSLWILAAWFVYGMVTAIRAGDLALGIAVVLLSASLSQVILISMAPR